MVIRTGRGAHAVRIVSWVINKERRTCRARTDGAMQRRSSPPDTLPSLFQPIP